MIIVITPPSHLHANERSLKGSHQLYIAPSEHLIMRPKSRTEFRTAIICALTLEAEAVEALFDETYDKFGKIYGKRRGDANSYINGRIGKHDVVLCYMPGMGKGSAASVASSLRVSYTGVQLALVVGICGGAPNPFGDQEIFLGDVIIGNALVEYDFGRQYPRGFERKSDALRRPDQEIRTLLAALSTSRARAEFQEEMLHHLHKIQQQGPRWQHPGSADILFEASYHHKHYNLPSRCCCVDSNLPDDICEETYEKNCNSLGCDENRISRRRDKTGKPSIHIGKVATADMVMKSGEHRDRIISKERVIGFEMEGAGVWDNVSCIIIKGVCDYADSHKNKTWQAYAAATGASTAKAFLRYRSVDREG
jgi:nucleoside phosphorylase